MSTKKWIVGAGLAVAVVLVVLVWKGTFPPQSGMEGAIGAAKRYQSEQLAAGDVSLTDPDIQDLLQSDLFHQIVTDASFRDMYLKQSEALRTVLTDARFRDLLGKQGFTEVMRSDVFRQAVEQNKYELLQKASATDFQKSRLAQEASLDKASTSVEARAEVEKNVEASRTALARAGEELGKAEVDYDRAVTSLLRTEEVMAKSGLQAEAEASKAALVRAREEMAKRELDYQRAVGTLSKTQDAAQRQQQLQKVEATRAAAVQAREAVAQRQADLDRNLSHAFKVAGAQEALSKVEASRASLLQSKVVYGKAQESFDRQVTAIIGSSLDRQSTAQDYARAQELSRSDTFRQVFADANFRELSKSEEFSKLIALQRFQEVAKLDAFQKAAQNPEMWKQVATGDAMERAATMKADVGR